VSSLSLSIHSTHANVQRRRPPLRHPDRSVAQWRDLRLPLVEKRSPEAVRSRHSFAVPEGETAFLCEL
jgi:hypothetical protein